jgi:hypothetical protein
MTDKSVERYLDQKMYDEWDALDLGGGLDEDGLKGFWNEYEAIIGLDTYEDDDQWEEE